MSDRSRKSARGNRWGLFLLGLVFLAVGAAALATGFRVFGTPAAAAPVLGAPAVGLMATAWMPWAVAAVGAVLALLALRWLLVQGRTDVVRRVEMSSDRGEGNTQVDGSAVCRAVEGEVSVYPGVRRARAQLIGRAAEPRVRLDVGLDDGADATEVWSRCAEHACARMRETLELDRLPAVIRLSLAPPTSSRAPSRTPERAPT